MSESDTETADEPEYGWRLSRHAEAVHYDRHCRHLERSDRDPIRVALDATPDYEEMRCVDCWPGLEVERPRPTGVRMERITLRVPKEQIQSAEQLVERGLFPSRSELVRTALRDLLKEHNNQPRDRIGADPPWRDA